MFCSLMSVYFQESERFVAELTETWEERLQKSEAIKAER